MPSSSERTPSAARNPLAGEIGFHSVPSQIDPLPERPTGGGGIPPAATQSRRYHDWYGGERRQSWATPPAFFAPLHEEYGFTLDGASEAGNGLLPRASTADAPISWEGERVFCNPPWSNIRPFVELAATAELAVLLVPARTCARWFHRALDLGATVRYFKPKPKFVGAKHVSPVDCVLLVFGSTAEEVAA